MKNKAYLSIIIPTLNRYTDLQNTIQYLINQTFSNYEILIIDQSELHDFQSLSQIEHRVKHIHKPNFKSASKARNLGIQEAKGDLLLFLDDDIIIDDTEYLTRVLSNFNSEIHGVVGPILDAKSPKFRYERHKWSYNKNWGWLFFPRTYGYSCRVKDGGAGNLAVRRKCAIAVGGMNENYEKGAHREESDFNMRYTQKYGDYLYDKDCYILHIGAVEGGVRTWNKLPQKYLKAQHHFDGGVYFIMKNVKLKHYLPHFLSFFMFYFYHKEFLKNPKHLFIALLRLVKAYFNARKMLKKKQTRVQLG